MLTLRDVNKSYAKSEPIGRLLRCKVLNKWGPANNFASKWNAIENVWDRDARLIHQSADGQRHLGKTIQDGQINLRWALNW
jgi:hypothetical protein